MATKAQLGMLFGLFKRLSKDRKWSEVEAPAQRDELTVRALGIDVTRELIPSWGKLSQRQVDAIKAALKEAIGEDLPLQATPAGAETLGDAAARARLVFAIERDSTAAYGSQTNGETAIATICADVHGPHSLAALGRWRALPLGDLENLAKTCARCERRNRGNSKIREYP